MIVTETPASGKEYCRYDSAGNLLYKKDRKGQEFTFTYDERNRLKSQKLGTTTIGSYDYDKASRLLWTENNTGRTSYEYYENGNLKKVTEADGRYICYEYDNIGNRTKMTDHFGQVIDYGYDSRSRLNTVKAGTNTTSYGYYLNGSLKSIAYPGAVTEEYSYDGAINLNTLANKKSGTVIDQFAYTYDGAGNQKSKTENGQSVYYGYDALNRVQTVSSTNAAQPAPQDMIAAYTYDSAGNIDNMYSENFSVGVTADYTFNELNQLTQYTESERSPVSYTYYPNGLRKTKAVDGITTTYYYDGQNVIIETENGSLKYRNIYGMNQIARQDVAGNINYFLYNGHGDVTKLVDSTGNIKNRYEYDIYGKVTNAVENGIPNPMRYAGQMYDNESGLYYLRARYYDPRIGRFISEDTNKGDINNPSSLNLYTYCWGNPIRYFDFDGHQKASVQEKLYALIHAGAYDSLVINNIAKSSINMAVKYARNNKMFWANGNPNTTDNSADALRHFSWNYDSVKVGNVSIKDVEQVMTNHEQMNTQFLYNDKNGVTYYKVRLSSLMDLYNNKMGRYYADLNAKNSTTSLEAFNKLVSEGRLITSLDQVAQFYNFDTSWIIEDKDKFKWVIIQGELNEDPSKIKILDKSYLNP